jgi:3D (Asp-Asp-Asp) domain-containing protein
MLAAGSARVHVMRGTSGSGPDLVSLSPTVHAGAVSRVPVTNRASDRVLERHARQLVRNAVQDDHDAMSGPQLLERRLRVTAYCDRGTTAAGIPSGVGQCAAPEDVPFGSIIYIPSLNRSFVVTDRTHKRFRQTTVDIFMPDREECLEFGRSHLDCVIILPETPHRYGCPTIYAKIAEVQGGLASAQ